MNLLVIFKFFVNDMLYTIYVFVVKQIECAGDKSFPENPCEVRLV
jgi:hypothetical protein